MADQGDIRFNITIDNSQVDKKLNKSAKSFKQIQATVGGVNTTLNVSKNAWKQYGKAVQGTNQQNQQFLKSSPAVRYALYDISSSFRKIAVGAAGLAAVPLGFAIKYERDFANVQRTNELVGDSIERVRNDLLEIAKTTPISWADITNIGALAGQLGIGEGAIASFTETVAKFSATTDLSVDASATAFGRLDQLISGVDGQFNNLGSAILAVGVDSVSTESQIVNVATNIASMGNLAGLTGAEIIGLSGALASLGVRPELARGNITRLFSNIGEAASTGGERLAEFGRITGRSADQFADDWGTEPAKVLQDFFAGINNEGKEAERTLRSLGITSVRDIPAILRLAQSSDEVSRLIALSTQEFLLGAKVQEQYSIISSTTAEQLNRLGQNFQTLGASVLDATGPLSAIIGVLNEVVEFTSFLAATPFGQTFGAIGITVALVTAVFAGYVAIMASVAASLFAARFAARELGGAFAFLNPLVLIGGKSFTALAVNVGISTAAIRVFSIALKALGIIGAIAGVVGLAITAFQMFTKETKASGEAAQAYFGDLTRFEEAIRKDTEAMDDGTEALRTFNIAHKDAADATQDARLAGAEYLKVLEAEEKALGNVTKARDKDTLAIGANFEARLRENLVGDPAVSSAFGDENFVNVFESAGGSGDELVKQIALGQGEAYVQGIVEAIEARRNELNKAITNVAIDLEPFGGGEAAQKELYATGQALKFINKEFNQAIEANDAIVPGIQQTSSAYNVLGGEAADVAESSALLKDSISEVLDSLFLEANYIKDVEDALGGYAKAFAESGDAANEASGPIQDVIDNIISKAPGGDVNIILGNLAGLLALLESQGPSTAASQEIVRSAIAAVGRQANIETTDILAYASAINATANFDAANFQDIMAAALEKTGKSAGGAAKKVKTLNEQFDELVDSMFEAINLGTETENAIFALGEAFGETGDEALYASEEMQDAIGSILAQSGSAEEGVANLAALFSGLAKTVGGESAPALQILRQAISQVAAQFGISEAQAQQFIDTVGGGISTINFDNFNRGIQNAQQEVRTLLDYASDLESVFGRAFDIRFANTFAIDNIAEAWFKLGQNVEDARREVEDLVASQQDLGADRALKEYFLSVANAYGDTLRAAQLRKEIADLDREQADNAIELNRSRALAGGDLTGQGEGERQNRAALLGLVGDYQSYIGTLAESGASQDELRKATERARKEFIAQALELGYQEDVVLEYAKAFDDVRTAIDNVPRNITVDANVNPALQALNELNAKLNESIQVARNLNTELGRPISSPNGGPVVLAPSQKEISQSQLQAYDARIVHLNAAKNAVVSGGAISQIEKRAIEKERQAIIEARRWTARAAMSFASGGFTGRGGTMAPAGIVHKGEYVVPQKYVNQSTGLPDANFLSQLQNGMRGYAQGGFVGGGGSDGTMMVELSPYDRKLLSDAGNVQLRLNGKVVAEATNANNFNEARRGSN